MRPPCRGRRPRASSSGRSAQRCSASPRIPRARGRCRSRRSSPASLGRVLAPRPPRSRCATTRSRRAAPRARSRQGQGVGSAPFARRHGPGGATPPHVRERSRSRGRRRRPCPPRAPAGRRSFRPARALPRQAAPRPSPRSRVPRGGGRASGSEPSGGGARLDAGGARVRRHRLESRRPRGAARAGRRGDAHAAGDDSPGRLDAPGDRPGRDRRSAALPERRSRARDGARPGGASRCLARDRAGPRPRPARGGAGRPADDRSRPSPLRRAPDPPLRAGNPAPAAPRAAFRPGAARRARPEPRSPWKRSGPDSPREARLSGMSHLDELDEFEAELELRLKKEYTAVFGMFRYCVLTQDATYLCNKLELTQISQPAYPFFHLKMEDVWVWDKNRPTRIIPRAEAWTSSDVTVEELRAEGDEPSLTAEALAEKIGESASSDDDI